MNETSDWQIPDEWQPDPADVAYDLERALSSVVFLRANIPEDAFTAGTLGVERAGNGVVIDSRGLVLTIGYLITEAETVWLMGANGRACPAHVVAYDQRTGFGLVQSLEDLGLPALPLGESAALGVGDNVVIAGSGGSEFAVAGQVIGKREFAGYWEYVLDEALFTAPPHPSWGGTAVIDEEGALCGIGSLFIQQPRETGDPLEANMVVPIDILKPILGDLLAYGRQRVAPRPWLGMYTADSDDTLIVAGVATNGPADKAGVAVGDAVLEVAGRRPDGLADLFRRIWALGEAGVEVPLTLNREGQRLHLTLASVDRTSMLKAPKLH